MRGGGLPDKDIVIDYFWSSWLPWCEAAQAMLPVIPTFSLTPQEQTMNIVQAVLLQINIYSI